MFTSQVLMQGENTKRQYSPQLQPSPWQVIQKYLLPYHQTTKQLLYSGWKTPQFILHFTLKMLYFITYYLFLHLCNFSLSSIPLACRYTGPCCRNKWSLYLIIIMVTTTVISVWFVFKGEIVLVFPNESTFLQENSASVFSLESDAHLFCVIYRL